MKSNILTTILSLLKVKYEKIYILIILIGTLTNPPALYAEQSLPPSSVDSISVAFREQLTCFPQEKLYLHLDKSRYVGGERIWFRAYMMDASSHIPVILSNCLYVELLSSADSLLTRVKLIPTDSCFSGYLDVPEEAKAGVYKLRAYTNYMRNVGEDYFFMRKVVVDDLTYTKGTEYKPQKTTSAYNVSFFPEGGRIPSGTFCHVGIKALNENGFSEEVTGFILDEKGDTITTFETIHAGLGVLGVELEAGKKYHAVCINRKGVEKKYPFLDPESDVCSLQTRWTRDKLVVSLAQSPDMSDASDDYSLVVHCRGIVLFSQKWEKEKSYLSFDKESLPSGVIQILLIDKEMKPISERLMFSKNDDQAHVSINLDKTVYTSREHVKVNLSVTDPSGKPMRGNISVSVTDDSDVLPDTTISIMSSLLLASDLKGYIEDPEFYFRENSPLSERSLDCLMLTQGWRRYHVDRILHREYDKPTEILELGRFVTGKVTYSGSNKPLKDIQVNIMSPGINFLKSTRTDKNGKFKLEGFEHPDSTLYVISALAPGNNDYLKLNVDDVGYPAVNIPWISTSKVMNNCSSYREKAYQRRFHDPNIRTIDLEGVVIKGKKTKKKKILPLHLELSERTLTNETIERFQPSTVKSLLELTQALSVIEGGVYLNRFGRESLAMVLVDGFEEDWRLINVHDIERVDVIFPPRSIMYGLNAAGGVVVLTTKSGSIEDSNKPRLNTYQFTPLGYQTYVEFYSPVYKTASQKNSPVPDLRTTIYWNPNLSLSKKGDTFFEFYSSDATTGYSIVIEGVTDNGRLIHEKKHISIKNSD